MHERVQPLPVALDLGRDVLILQHDPGDPALSPLWEEGAGSSVRGGGRDRPTVHSLGAWRTRLRKHNDKVLTMTALKMSRAPWGQRCERWPRLSRQCPGRSVSPSPAPEWGDPPRPPGRAICWAGCLIFPARSPSPSALRRLPRHRQGQGSYPSPCPQPWAAGSRARSCRLHRGSSP